MDASKDACDISAVGRESWPCTRVVMLQAAHKTVNAK
jgi:hypothetical protein